MQRIIQVGVGGHGRSWVNIFAEHGSPHAEVVAMVDRDEAALAAAAEKLPGVPRFGDLSEALAVESDAVLIVTPPPLHRAMAEAALAADRHVLIEKPLADSMADARAIVDAADAAGKTLMVSQNRRWNAGPLTLKTILDAEPVGPIHHVVATFHLPGDFGGTFRARMRHVLLIDMAVHHVDLFRHFTSLDATRVYARSFNPPGSWADHGVALSMIVDLANGGSFTYHGDWSAHGDAESWEADWRLQGPAGSVRYRHGSPDEVVVSRCEPWGQNVQHEVTPIADHPPSQAAVLRHFDECIKSGTEPVTSGRDNLKTLAIIFAAAKSAEENRPVDVAEVM